MKSVQVLRRGLGDWYKNLWMVVPSAVLFLVLIGLSRISVEVNYNLGTTPVITIWLIIFVLLMGIVMSWFFSGIIGLSLDAVSGRLRLGRFFNYAGKFWFRNFQIIVIIAVFWAVLNRVSWYLAGLTVPSLGKYSVLVFSGMLFLGLAGGIIFLTYASFFLVKQGGSAFVGIKKSLNFVKRNYIDTLLIIIVFFVISAGLRRIDENLALVVEIIFVVPYLALVLARMIE